MKKNVIISWSSGKDSTLALERLRESHDYEVIALYTTYVGSEVPFQATPLNVVAMQAGLIGLPLITIELPETFPPNHIYKETITSALKSTGLVIDAIAFGDMHCNGIAEYRQSYIEPAGWECLFPLMGESSHDLAQEIIDRGIETFLVTVDTDALNSSYCGKKYDSALIRSLPINVDPCGENGEFHTLVTKAPCFDGELELELTHIDSEERFISQRYQAKIKMG
ncbi:ATPase [Vibrio sp. 10N.286.49.B3]|uniref:Dph6-related ATP pyrophosphatase n=1 Tax=Vibrio sp. 10N.286.49.B3 TaxID=1880855 RepID=UPI000C83BFF6|nr:ATPase [Vibrio sp. 10N.286.49.B3]PMH45419.1 ATPase [Vibrio sp. 10N.286.49.B3]